MFNKKHKAVIEPVDEGIDEKPVDKMSDEELQKDISMNPDVMNEKMKRALKNVMDKTQMKMIEVLNESDVPCHTIYKNGHFLIRHEILDLEDPKTYYKKKVMDMFVLSAQLPNGNNVLLKNLDDRNWQMANRLIQRASQSGNYNYTFDEFKFMAKIGSILEPEEINTFYNVETKTLTKKELDLEEDGQSAGYDEDEFSNFDDYTE